MTGSPSARPRIAVLYHYFHPDDVVSARHFSDLAEGLARRGWAVEAFPSNRGCRDEGRAYRLRETWRSVVIRRVWRPRFRQTSNGGRGLNAAWLIAAWSLLALRRPKNLPEVVLVGTDPPLSVVAALVWKLLRRRVKVAHWCFDLHPEASIAEDMVDAESFAFRTARRLMGAAYRRCDLIADLGPCMRRRLSAYGSAARMVTLTPWALVENVETPPRADPAERHALFGEARLALLYSGNFGRAHSWEEFLALADRLRGEPIRFCFSVRGNRAAALADAIGSRPNVAIVEASSEDRLAVRLAAADIHLASLREGWTGAAVPSKFFGSLAAGRPVLYAGSRDSAIGEWIAELGVGWLLEPVSIAETAALLRRLAQAPALLRETQERCRRVYAERFSREQVLERWHGELTSLIGRGGGSGAADGTRAAQEIHPPARARRTGTGPE